VRALLVLQIAMCGRGIFFNHVGPLDMCGNGTMAQLIRGICTSETPLICIDQLHSARTVRFGATVSRDLRLKVC
jgi:hypothetical protein